MIALPISHLAPETQLNILSASLAGHMFITEANVAFLAGSYDLQWVYIWHVTEDQTDVEAVNREFQEKLQGFVEHIRL